MQTLKVKTGQRTQFVDITAEVQAAVARASLDDGAVMVYVPHTTAGITINESADPCVADDVQMVLNQVVPWQAAYTHREGNSPAHVKSTLVGASELVAVENGKLVLGTWQGLFFCEFDGPRTRKVLIKCLQGI